LYHTQAILQLNNYCKAGVSSNVFNKFASHLFTDHCPSSHSEYEAAISSWCEANSETVKPKNSQHQANFPYSQKCSNTLKTCLMQRLPCNFRAMKLHWISHGTSVSLSPYIICLEMTPLLWIINITDWQQFLRIGALDIYIQSTLHAWDST
jgi:hypothetical protein